MKWIRTSPDVTSFLNKDPLDPIRILPTYDDLPKLYSIYHDHAVQKQPKFNRSIYEVMRRTSIVPMLKIRNYNHVT